MDVPKTEARPNNSISVTVREPSSMRNGAAAYIYGQSFKPYGQFLLAVFPFLPEIAYLLADNIILLSINDSGHTNRLPSLKYEMTKCLVMRQNVWYHML